MNYVNKGPILFDKSIGSVQKKESVVIKDILSSDTLQYPEEAKKEGIRAIVSLPILLNDNTIGSLRLYHYETWDISDHDLDSLMILSEVIGLAMMYTRFLNASQIIKETVTALPME